MSSDIQTAVLLGIELTLCFLFERFFDRPLMGLLPLRRTGGNLNRMKRKTDYVMNFWPMRSIV